jgi:hypothetical protein
VTMDSHAGRLRSRAVNGIRGGRGARPAGRPNVFFHYTPTSAGWMNMAGIWLGVLTRKSLRGAGFRDTRAPCARIAGFAEAHSGTAKPFAQGKRGAGGGRGSLIACITFAIIH